MTKRRKEFEPGHGYTKEDWDAVSDSPEITREDLAKATTFDRAFPDLAKRARRVRGLQRAPTKVQVSIRLSRDVVDYFKADGEGWQARIDEALRKVARGQ